MSQISDTEPLSECPEDDFPPMIAEAIDENGWGNPIVPGSPPAVVLAQGEHSFYRIDLSVAADPPLLACLITGPEVRRKRRRSLCEAINHANVRSLMGHFQLDPSTGHLQYRIVMPLHEATVGVETVELLGFFGLDQFGQYLPRFLAVVRGELSPWEAIWEMGDGLEEGG